ncbi:hypothetical protein ACLBXM_04610 [Xanthobacteraceae bacterium A53D]
MSLNTNSAAALITASVAEAREERMPHTEAVGFDEFGAIWVKAKPLLNMAATLLPLLPGAGTIAGPVLNGLIKIGDQIAVEQAGG